MQCKSAAQSDNTQFRNDAQSDNTQFRNDAQSGNTQFRNDAQSDNMKFRNDAQSDNTQFRNDAQSGNMKFRNAAQSDMDNVIALVNLAYQDAHWFKQPSFYNRISGHVEMSQFIIGSLDNVMVACLSMHVEGSIATISMLSIHPNYQRRGLARQLFEHACTLTQGIIQVEVVNLQEHLVQIYKSWGFKQTGTCTWEEMGVDSTVNIKIPSHFIIMQRGNKA